MGLVNLLSIGSVFSTILSIVIAVCILLLMVLIHELGHYVVGRLLGFKITEFSIGFGKALFSKVNKRGEKISLRIFPLGGYCAFAGENDDEEDAKKDNKKKEEVGIEIEEPKNEKPRDYLLFSEQKPWKRILVYIAGVSFNFISAILFSFIFLVSYGYDIPQVVSIKEGYQQNIVAGDAIYKVDGVDINFINENTFSNLIAKYDINEDITLTVKHENGEFEDVIVTVRQLKYDDTISLTSKDKDGNDVSIYCDANGVDITAQNVSVGDLLYYKNAESGDVVPVAVLGISTKPYAFPFFEAIGRSFTFTFGLAWIVIKTFWLLITFQLPLNQLGGPIATIGILATAASGGLQQILFMLPLLAANLAVFNILPFPALDGSHVIFTLVEWIRGKPVNKTVESYIHAIGLIVLFAFVIIVDIIHLIG